MWVGLVLMDTTGVVGAHAPVVVRLLLIHLAWSTTVLATVAVGTRRLWRAARNEGYGSGYQAAQQDATLGIQPASMRLVNGGRHR